MFIVSVIFFEIIKYSFKLMNMPSDVTFFLGLFALSALLLFGIPVLKKVYAYFKPKSEN